MAKSQESSMWEKNFESRDFLLGITKVNNTQLENKENVNDHKAENKDLAKGKMDENKNGSSSIKRTDGNSKELKDNNSDDRKSENGLGENGKEKLKDQKSENKDFAEGKMDENKNGSSSIKRTDGNSKELKDNNPDDRKSENGLGENGKEKLKDQKSENKDFAEGKMDENKNRSSSIKRTDGNSKELKDNNSDDRKSENGLGENGKEKLKDQKSENKDFAEGKMDENKNGSSSIKRTDGNSKELKDNNSDDRKSENGLGENGKEKLKDQKSENNNSDEKGKEKVKDEKSHGPTKVQTVSTKVSDYIKVIPNLCKELGSAFEEIQSLNQAECLINKIEKCESDPIKFLDVSDIKTIYTDKKEEAWLKANGQEWKNFIDPLRNEFDCIIFSDENFTKIHLCCTMEEINSIHSKIKEFLDQNPIDIEISPYVKEFVKHNEKFFDLHLEEKVQDKKIWIRKISKSRLTELKKEINQVRFQSYLLDDNQYELICAEKQELLSYIEKEYHVKGSSYQLPVVGDIPVVFQVDQLTNITCVVNSEPENIPVDSLITVDWKEFTSTSGLTILAKYKKENCKVLVNDSWNLPMNHHIILSMPGMDKRKTSYSWGIILDMCIKKVFENGMSPHTIGINIPTEMLDHLLKFCQNILIAIKKFPQNDKRPIHILLCVQTNDMMHNVIKVLKSYSASKSKENLPNAAPEECTVEVIEALIHEIEVDVVVCSVSNNLNLKNGAVSKALSSNAGPELQSECSQKYPKGIAPPEIAITAGYRLPCHHVFYGALQRNDGRPNICTFIENCLQKAAEMGKRSIAFPLLGTGSLDYKTDEVAKQMESAIRKFKDKTTESSLKQILIVIFPGSLNDKDLSLLKYTLMKINDSKGAIQKREIAMPMQNEETQILNVIYGQLQWIQFFNYSTERKTLNDVIMEFEKSLKNDILPVSVDELKELHFFYDLMKLVPDIVQQMTLEQNHILVPTKSSKEFKHHLIQLREHCNKAVFHIPEDMDRKIIEYLLIKIRQDYPKVKCEIANNNKDVVFRTPDFDSVEEAKFQLESLIGLRENIAMSPDRFRSNEPKAHDNEATGHASSALGLQRPSASNSKKNIDIKSFLSLEGLLVKVYEGNLLTAKVDGIVNAANKFLNHGGGVALAIIKAAGKSVNEEGKSKLQGRPLQDGEVLSTSAGNLKQYKYIIHAVGPTYSSNSAEYCKIKIKDTVYNTLDEANRLGLTSVALPAISSAIFAVPLHICTEGYLLGVEKFSKLKAPNCKLKEVHFVDLIQEACTAIKDCFAKKLNAFPMEIGQPNVNQRKPENSTENDENMCPVCLEEIYPAELLPCQHCCCHDCKKKLLQPLCPICRLPFGEIYGNQPDGQMIVDEERNALPGFKGTRTYRIEYFIGNNRWKPSTYRVAYLPKNKRGDVILKMLQLAFKRRLIFTVGESRTTRAQNSVTWNEIHHKTSRDGGLPNYGYPDPDYFNRVTQELADKAITPDSVANKNIEKSIKLRNGRPEF